MERKFYTDKGKCIGFRFMRRLRNGVFKSPFRNQEYNIVNNKIEDQMGFHAYSIFPPLPILVTTNKNDIEWFILAYENANGGICREVIIDKAEVIFHGTVKELLKIDLNVLKSKMLKYGVVEEQISALISDIESSANALGYR